MSRDFTPEPPRGFEPRTYALRAVRESPRTTFFLVDTPEYLGISVQICAMFRGITGAFRDQASVPAHGLMRLSSSAIRACATSMS